MKNNRQNKPKERKEEVAVTPAECTEFFIGWMRRLGHALILFVFPLNRPNL